MGFFNRSEHPQEQISAFVDGELDARQSESVARHLAGCAECTTLLEELREARAMLSALPREAPRRSFVLGPEHARERVAVSAPGPRRRSSFSFAPAIAATVLIGLLFADAINLQSSSQDESTAGGLGAASQGDLAGRQSMEDASKGAPMPATAAESANSTSAADSARTPAADGGSGSGTGPTPMIAPAQTGPVAPTVDGPVAPPATGPGVPAPTPGPAQAQTGPTVAQPPSTGGGNLPAQTVGPLSTFGTDVRAPQPEEDADGFADAVSGEEDSGLSTLRILQILAGIALVGSVFYVYVRPRLFERK